MFDESLAGKRNEVLALFLAEAAAVLAPIRPPAINQSINQHGQTQCFGSA